MKKITFTIAFIFVYVSLISQDPKKEYRLLGIDDNIEYVITIDEDLENDIVSFTTKNHTLSIFDARGIDSISSHLNRFLEVQLIIRGGSGLKLRETALMCVAQGRAVISLQLTSQVFSTLTRVYDKVADSLKLFDEESKYQLLISVEKKGSEFIATLAESSYVRSKYDPSDNESFEGVFKLNFDRSGNFFFNATKNLHGKFRLYSHKENTYQEKFLSVTVPCVQLTRTFNVLMDGIWFDEGRENILRYRN